ncbi:glycoside hydrolase family 3 N-terminal domain-containing protein [Anaeromicrobium sediminis]|uniref:beta-glucosidase n=1 Tax=Anaeromicrobium sediminis TaxID=1478221 RepID=A0A267MMZ9_9FIRM|nr:glycoside hydrolase family 3 N-terminal domain-containing protein [Anaeromicrobium sediminis]PAB60298.1 glycosyl hydrolase [Anaeromicrobium sediminis]
MSQIYKNPSYTPEERTNDLLKRMTIEEKVGQMCQIDGRIEPEKWIYERHVGSFLHVTGDAPIKLQKMALKTRLGIPILFGIDAVHGHAFYSGATVFPSQLAMASSWNPELLEKVARITAHEVILTGMHWTFSPILCIGRDMRWGRVDETFGEDPYLIGELSSAMIEGYQGENLSSPTSILACAKHFAAYGETVGGRDSSEAHVSERQLKSLFFPPFKKAVESGCSTFMAGYNSIDGIPCSANSWMLKDILKDEWKFKGFVVTDWDNVGNLHTKQKVAASMKEACKIAVECGNNMIMSTPDFYDHTVELVKEGTISEKLLNKACRPILEYKFKLGLFDKKRFPDMDEKEKIIGCPNHKKFAYEVALESIVLLKNEDNILPLRDDLKQIALIGPSCDDVQAQLGDWSFGTREHPKIPTYNYHKDYDISPIVTVLNGMKKRLGPNTKLVYNKGCDMLDENNHFIDEAVNIAMDSDVIIAVVGDTNILNGEMRDRVDLNLTGAQDRLLKELYNTNKPLIVVLLNGKPLTIPWIKEHAHGILEAFNPGMEGGNAIASILFGDYNPSGKLTISFPKHVGQQPVYYNKMPGWHGGEYVEMDDTALFPFGYGLSYTKYKYSNLKISSKEVSPKDTISVSIDIENIGNRTGTEIIQLYINDIYSSITTPIKELKAFSRVTLEKGEKTTVHIPLSISSLSLINKNNESLVEPGEFEIMVGSSSRDEDLLKDIIRVI